MNSYETTVKNNTETGHVDIKIISQRIIDDKELEAMKYKTFNEVKELIENLYGGKVIRRQSGF